MRVKERANYQEAPVRDLVLYRSEGRQWPKPDLRLSGSGMAKAASHPCECGALMAPHVKQGLINKEPQRGGMACSNPPR
jgi:hypothetical protein